MYNLLKFSTILFVVCGLHFQPFYLRFSLLTLIVNHRERDTYRQVYLCIGTKYSQRTSKDVGKEIPTRWRDSAGAKEEPLESIITLSKLTALNGLILSIESTSALLSITIPNILWHLPSYGRHFPSKVGRRFIIGCFIKLAVSSLAGSPVSSVLALS